MESFRTAAWPFAGQDIRSLLEWRREASRDRTFLVWAPFDGEERTWTYGAFVDRVERFAAGLDARGVRPGDRVLVHMENSPEFLVAWLGCAAAGVVAVTTNARSSAEELKYYCGDAGAVAAVTQPKFAEMVASACGDLAWIATTATDAGSAPSEAWPRSDRFDAISADPAAAPPRARDPGAPFSVQYTSGTTSRPKGVVWTHANALWGARVSAAHEDLREDVVTLKHLASEIAEAHEVPKTRAETMLADTVDRLARHLVKGNKVRIVGLGIFQVKRREARMGRNPQTGEAVKIQASKKVTFRAGKELKEAV